jgi:UDP-2,4-diacetamido-2,4,6-trideoxy-beta-L-altropyranose hydrolase
MQRTLLIRADAGVAMGTGHVMRMIALAQAWQDKGGNVVFLSAELTPALVDRLKSEHFLVQEVDAVSGSSEDLKITSSAIAGFGDDVAFVALDGYQFNADFQIGIKNAGARLLVMDDYGHASFYHADVVLNQNVTACEAMYANRSSYTRLLLGTQFTLLRREFLKYRGLWRVVSAPPRKVLVTLGGTDPANFTQRIIEVLAEENLHVKAVVGGSNPHLESLRQCVERIRNKPACIELLVNPQDMPELIYSADLAFAAGGSTVWELFFLGLPSVLFKTTDNQSGVTEYLARHGLAIVPESGTDPREALKSLVASPCMTKEILETISTRCSKVVDGYGCERVIGEMLRP